MSGLRIGVLISGSGSNLQSIIDASKKGEIKSQVVCVLSNKETAYGLERARQNEIDAYYINPEQETYDQKVLEKLKASKVDLVVLAGYLKIVPRELIKAYEGKIINIHPSLLPKYGGKGYYGIKVHKAVLENDEIESGATVHFVDEGIDTGKIILQGKVPVLKTDTPESLGKRVLKEVEHSILTQAIWQIEKGRISV